MNNKIKDIDQVIKDIIENPYNYAINTTIDNLVDILKKLSYAYYNTQEELVPDNVYDIMLDVLEERDPDNLYLSEVGAPISKDKVQLPYHMASLNKIKTDTALLNRWIDKYTGPYVVSDKLDGVSALFVKKGKKLKMYTRGDGNMGQDISYLIPYVLPTDIMNGLPLKIVFRGELIISKKLFTEFNKKNVNKLKNARNAVAGLVNSKNYSVELAKITEFIIYTIIEPDLNYIDQTKLMTKMKLPHVHYSIQSHLTMEILSELLKKRREESVYAIDGIVVADSSKKYQVTTENPSHAFAFKQIFSDQVAETVVIKVEWNLSQYGYFKPRIKVQTIHLDDIDINYATAHNAKFINDNKIGPGAKVVIIRSGDVIPYIKSVISPATNGQAQMPETPYKWNKSMVNIYAINADDGAKRTIKTKQLAKFFSTMHIMYMGESTVAKFVDLGYDNILAILKAKKQNLYDVEGLGKKSIDKIYENINEGIQNATLDMLMAGSGIFGEGVGTRKLKIIINEYTNIMTENWNEDTLYNKIIVLDGFSDITTKKISKNFVAFKKFFDDLSQVIDLSHMLYKTKTKKNTQNTFIDGKTFVMTGFRDKEMQTFIENNGGKVTGSVSSKTDCLIYADGENTSSKYKKATQLGKVTMTKTEFIEKFMKN